MLPENSLSENETILCPLSLTQTAACIGYRWISVWTTLVYRISAEG